VLGWKNLNDQLDRGYVGHAESIRSPAVGAAPAFDRSRANQIARPIPIAM
jgi:hypothetical protein